MTFATWAMFGSLLINSAFGVVVGTTFSVGPNPALAAESQVHCPAARAHTPRAPDATPGSRRGYLVAVRMGWAAG